MKTIEFFHPEETFIYYIDRCFCKVVFSNQQHQLLIEIHSTDDLDHVEGDALQNDFPHVALTVDDFPVNVQDIDQLDGKTIEIPHSFVEIEDEDGHVDEFYYSNLNVSEGYFESDRNKLSFFKDDSGTLCLKWSGEVRDFIDESDDYIPFELECNFSEVFDEEHY